MVYKEDYFSDGQLDWKGVEVNGSMYGCIESYWKDGSVCKYDTGYFLDEEKVSSDNKKGYCYIWCKVVV